MSASIFIILIPSPMWQNIQEEVPFKAPLPVAEIIRKQGNKPFFFGVERQLQQWQRELEQS